MAKQTDKKFNWAIKGLSFLKPGTYDSDIFVIGGCKWRLSSAPKGNNPGYTYLFLSLVNGPSMPSGWRRYVKYRLTIVNQFSEELLVLEEGLHWFDSGACNDVFASMFHFSKLKDRDGEFPVYGEVKIVVEVDVLEVIGKLDVPKDSEETTKPPSKIEEKDGVALKEASSVKESVDVKGFQVLASQVESVRYIFERHPDIAIEFRAKNQHLRKSCMNFLLSLVETLCQPLEELSNEDLVEADIALTYVKDAGFKVDWLEKKLDEVKEKKEMELSELARLQETEENLLKLKEKCSEIDALVEVQKAKLLATRTPVSFNDVI